MKSGLIRSICVADDLPLNVSRETLQSTKFMSQAKAVLIKRFIALMQKIAADDKFKYDRMMKAMKGGVPTEMMARVKPDRARLTNSMLKVLARTSSTR